MCKDAIVLLLLFLVGRTFCQAKLSERLRCISLWGFPHWLYGFISLHPSICFKTTLYGRKSAQFIGKAASDPRIDMPMPSCRKPRNLVGGSSVEHAPIHLVLLSLERHKALLCVAEMVKREYPLTSYASFVRIFYRRLPYCTPIPHHSPALHPLH